MTSYRSAWFLLLFFVVSVLALSASQDCTDTAGNVAWNFENIMPNDPRSAYRFVHNLGAAYQCEDPGLPCRPLLRTSLVDTAVETFVQSMGTNENAKNAARRCHTELGAVDFGNLFITSGAVRPCNWSDADVGLSWEGENNIPATQNAIYMRSHDTDGVYSDTGKNIQALAYLMDGQAHNPPVIHKYQGCYLEDKERFLGLAAKYTHPLPPNYKPTPLQ